jgi:hypothetical protein
MFPATGTILIYLKPSRIILFIFCCCIRPLLTGWTGEVDDQPVSPFFLAILIYDAGNRTGANCSTPFSNSEA